MYIRAGFEISFDCQGTTPISLLLSIHPSRLSDLITPHVINFVSPVRLTEGRDMFGNIVSRIVAPPGPITISTDFVIADSGLSDSQVPGARQVPVEDLPDEALSYLVGSRYCETDKLSDLAWSLFGATRTGWARVQAICDYVHSRIVFGYSHARNTRTAWECHEEGRGVCRDFAHLAIALCRCLNSISPAAAAFSF